MLELVRALKGLGLRVSLLPQVLDVVGIAVEFDDLDGMTMLGVRSFGSAARRGSPSARSISSSPALALVIAAPVMAIIALAIRLDSGGPVFFRQVRVGRDGRPLQILKFRTMVADAEQRKDELRKRQRDGDGLFKLPDDPRMTRVGRILRPTTLDELPQLINVLRGEMSIVGPRPLVLDEDAQIDGWDRRRLHLTPGMTGPLADRSARPGCRCREMVKIDYLYVARWSLWSDLKILLRTVPFVLRRRGL